MTINRTPSVVLFEKLQRRSAELNFESAERLAASWLTSYLEGKSEDVVLQKAEKFLLLAGELAPHAPMPQTPKTVLVEQFGGLCVGVSQLSKHVSSAGVVVHSLLPLVLQHSRRARLARDFLSGQSSSTITTKLAMGVLTGLQQAAPDTSFNKQQLEARLLTAMEDSFVDELTLVAHARHLSPSSLEALAQRSSDAASTSNEIITMMQSVLGNVVPAVERATAHSEAGMPVRSLTPQEQRTFSALTAMLHALGNDALKKLEPEAGDDEEAVLFKKHILIEFVQMLANASPEGFERAVAFYQTDAGRELAAKKPLLDCSVNTELYRAQIGRALEPFMEQVHQHQERERARQAEQFGQMLQGLMGGITQHLNLDDQGSRRALVEGFSSVMQHLGNGADSDSE